MPDAASHTLGSKVWVNDAVEGWVKGDVVKVEKGSLKVSTEKGSIRAYKPEECPLQNPQTAGGVEVQQLSSCDPQCSVIWRPSTICPAGCTAHNIMHPHCQACRLSQCPFSLAIQLLTIAGHDHAVLLERARRAVEPESKISIGWHLYLHRLNLDSSEPLCIITTAVRTTYDATV